MTTALLCTTPVAGSSYPPRTADQIALSKLIGSAPLIALYDPAVPLGRGLYNRVSRAGKAEPPGVNTILMGEMGGRPAVAVPDGTAVRRMLSDVSVDPDAWTVVAVIQIDGTASGVRDILRPEVADTLGGPLLRLSISADNRLQLMRNTGSTVRLSAPAPLPLGVPVVVSASFSTVRGVTLRANGVEVARNADDLTPLSGQYRAAEFHWTRDRLGSSEMLMGIMALGDEDLTSPLRIGSLARLEAGLMEWHGVPPVYRASAADISLGAAPVRPFASRAAFLAATVPASVSTIQYFDGGQQVELVRDDSGLAATKSDGSKWNPQNVEAPLFAFGASESAPDNGPAWQAALDWMAQGQGRRIVEWSGRTYRLQTGAQTRGNFDVEGDFKFLATADIPILLAVAPVQEIVALTADYSPGDLTLSVAAMSAAIAPGRWIKLLSDAVTPLSRDAGPAAGPSTARARCGRWIQVGSGSSPTSIALVKALNRLAGIDAYTGERGNAFTVAYGARVAVPQVRYGSLRGISWAYEDGHGDAPNQWAGQAITVSGYMAPIFRRLSSDRGYGPALSLGGNVSALVEYCDFRNLKSNPGLGQYGYGVHDTGYGTRVIGLTGERCRHVYTTGQSNAPENTTDPQRMWRQGDTVGSEVAFADVAGGAEDEEIILSPLDTHHGAVDISFHRCRISNCGSALNNRGINTRVMGLTTRAVGRAVYCYSERQDGDGYPLTAGKLPEDFASMTVYDLDAETTGTSVETTTANLLVRTARIRTSCRGVFVSGGGLSLAGDIDVTIDTMDGAAAAVVNGDYGQPSVIAPKSNLEPDRTLMGEPFVRIMPGTSLRIDARVAVPGGAATRLVSQITSPGAPDVFGRVINEGNIDLILPDDGVLWSQNASIECRGEGVVRYRREGGSDAGAALIGDPPTNIIPAKLVKLLSQDGSIYWDRAIRQWPGEKLVFSNGNLGIVHNGAAAQADLYTPPQDIVPYLVPGDSLRVELVFRKTGTSGTAVVAINTAGQSNNDTYTMPAEASFMRLTMIMDVMEAAKQAFWFDWQAGLNSTDPDPQRVQYRERTITQTAMSYAFRFGAPAMSGSDSIVLQSCRIWCTAGGGKVA